MPVAHPAPAQQAAAAAAVAALAAPSTAALAGQPGAGASSGSTAPRPAAQARTAAAAASGKRRDDSSDSDAEEAPLLAQAAAASKRGSSSDARQVSPAALLGYMMPAQGMKRTQEQRQQQAQQAAQQAQQAVAELEADGPSSGTASSGGAAGSSGGRSWLPESLQLASSSVMVTGARPAVGLRALVAPGRSCAFVHVLHHASPWSKAKHAALTHCRGGEHGQAQPLRLWGRAAGPNGSQVGASAPCARLPRRLTAGACAQPATSIWCTHGHVWARADPDPAPAPLLALLPGSCWGATCTSKCCREPQPSKRQLQTSSQQQLRPRPAPRASGPRPPSGCGSAPLCCCRGAAACRRRRCSCGWMASSCSSGEHSWGCRRRWPACLLASEAQLPWASRSRQLPLLLPTLLLPLLAPLAP